VRILPITLPLPGGAFCLAPVVNACAGGRQAVALGCKSLVRLGLRLLACGWLLAGSGCAFLPDIRACAAEVRSFCIKDHRNFPQDQDCGPGFGEIDHYKLLHPVAFRGLAMPLACENIFAPVVPRPKEAEGIDALARRAREFLEVVIAGLQAGKMAKV
jgi:hypothetical protein